MKCDDCDCILTRIIPWVQAMRKRLPLPDPPTPKGGTRPASAGCEAAPDRISPEEYVAQDEILKVLHPERKTI